MFFSRNRKLFIANVRRGVFIDDTFMAETFSVWDVVPTNTYDILTIIFPTQAIFRSVDSNE